MNATRNEIQLVLDYLMRAHAILEHTKNGHAYELKTTIMSLESDLWYAERFPEESVPRQSVNSGAMS